MQLSLGAKVQLGFFGAVALVIVIGVMAFIYLGRINHEVQDVLKKDILFARAGEAIKIYFLETRRAEKNYLVFGQDRDIKEYEFFVSKLKEALQDGKDVARKEETLDKYRAIEQHLQHYEQIFSRLLTVPSEARDEVQRVSQELSEVGHHISTLADEIADAKWAELEMHAHDADRIESVAKRNMSIILGFTCISSLLLGLYLPRKIVLPIRKLTNLIKRAQEEEFRINVDVTGNDEIGELGRFLNRMMDQIRVFDDLKVRKITEERRRLEVLSNLLREGVILVDSDGRVCGINPAALDFFGLSQSEVEGRSLKEIPLDDPFRQALLRSVDAHERFHDSVIALMPSDSGTQLRKITLSTAFVRDENGEIMSIVCVFRELENENGKGSPGDEVVKGVVEELAERLRAVLHAKDDKADADDKREEREVG
ncbi:MAG TPA: PAS domain-containing protein [Candidatus Tectomicrobia bacterium]|nr:PAS domain-containing protein [Candidatus Tectomicrobia bacterium]